LNWLFLQEDKTLQIAYMPQKTIQISTTAHNGLYDITRQVEAIVAESGVKTGLVNVYAQGATAGIMVLFI
jgi:thiamine phosphate synthase YjbQ (UPF0047 family)